MRVDNRVMLDSRRKRQEHLAACLDCGGHPHIDAEAPFQVLHHCIMPALRLGRASARQEVRVFEASHLEGVRLAGLQGIKHHIALSVEHKAHIGRVFLYAHDLRLQLRPQVVPAETQLQAVVHIADELAAWHIDVARYGLESQYAMACLDAVGFLVDRQTPGDLSRFGCSINAGRFTNLASVQAADLCRFLRWHILHALS